jgi:outer membrane protein assembly factor BamD
VKFSLKHIIVSLLAIFLVGCSTTKEDKYEEKPVAELYQKAKDLFDKGEYKKAAKAYEEVLRQHPYSKLCASAQLRAAECYYEGQEFEQAIASVDLFLQMHPGNPDVPYAHYLRGSCYFIQIKSVDRDQEMTENALHAFEEIVKRFPRSKYAKMSKERIILVHTYLAGQDMTVGRLYQSQGYFGAALGRFRNVVEKYEATELRPEALYRLVEVYLSLGIIKEARACAAFLAKNNRDTAWCTKALALLQSKNLAQNSPEEKLSRTWEQNSQDAAATNHP